jgi:hypothetical protein
MKRWRSDANDWTPAEVTQLRREGDPRAAQVALRWRCAVHEAGHAVAAVVAGETVSAVMLTPDPGADGALHPRTLVSITSDSAFLLLAGTAAERFFVGTTIPSGELQDLEEFLRLVDGDAPQPDGDRSLRRGRARAHAIVRRHRFAVHAVALRLFRDGSLDGSAVQEMVEEAE